MANNTDFLSSIKIESDFEEVIKRLVKHIYDAEAYLVGGPWDGGRDLVYKIKGKEVREIVQISITKNGLDKKLEEDAEKILKTVERHGYPKTFTFFYSHPLSASKKLNLKKSVREKTGLALEIYDATEIDQIISDDATEILRYLIEEIHGLKPGIATVTDVRTRSFYDYLALSKDAVELKTSIIDAQILSILTEGAKNTSTLVAALEEMSIKKGLVLNRIAFLAKGERLSIDGEEVSLSEKEQIRIQSILAKDDSQRQALLNLFKKLTTEKVGVDLSEQSLEIVKKVYGASIDIQISEIAFEPPRISIIKNLARELENLIIEAGANGTIARELTKELIEVSDENDYLSNYCASRLCVNLWQQQKFEKYVKEKTFFVYLDASVFIRYIALINFKRTEIYDREMRVTASLKEAIKSLSGCEIRITSYHLIETIRHITQAKKISSFASDELLQRFGDSKNVYFNLYLKEKQHKGKNYSFDQFSTELLGHSIEAERVGNDFQSYMRWAQRFLQMARISVQSAPDSLEREYSTGKIVHDFERFANGIKKPRKHLSALNDVMSCHVLADDYRHIDSKGVGHTPILVTWDSAFHELRSIYSREYPYSEWIVYSPQRALERFSMLNFNLKGSVLKDTVLAILDEDYIRESSLIDSLAVFLGEDKVESDSIVSVLVKLSEKTHREPSEGEQFDMDEKNTLNEALLHLQNAFRDDSPALRQVFVDPQNEPVLLEIFSNYVAGLSNKEILTKKVEALLRTLKTDAQGIQ